jgi:DNA processing protein
MPSFFPEAERAPFATTNAARATLAIDRDHPGYPSRLLELKVPPPVIYTRGTFAVAAPPAVAIVGTRTASPYGLRVARALATACVRAGVCVVSGLARGVDGVAHQAALDANGRTVAVLGTGPDLYYPRSHRTLQERIARDGLLISEHPPGSTGHGGSFPQRNRLIAALADVTVVVEAGEKSGALITATHAEWLGREVGVVPNAIDVPMAYGSNALLRQPHVVPILGADDLLALLNLEPMVAHLPALTGDVANVWDALLNGASDASEIARHTGLRLPYVQGALGLLEIDGLVQFDVAGRVRPSIT